MQHYIIDGTIIIVFISSIVLAALAMKLYNDGSKDVLKKMYKNNDISEEIYKKYL